MQDPEFEKSVNTNPEKDTNENDDFVLDSTFAGIPNGCELDPLDNEEARAVLKKEQELKVWAFLEGIESSSNSRTCLVAYISSLAVRFLVSL